MPASTDHQLSLSHLSTGSLLSIWEQLDDPVPLSQVNRRFQELSKDTFWRAKWLMRRYNLYLVISEAIARPRIFTGALLDQLLRLGAPLGRNVVQLLQVLWNPTMRGLMHNLDDNIRWGRISLAAYGSVMVHAASLVNEQKRECLNFCPASRALC